MKRLVASLSAVAACGPAVAQRVEPGSTTRLSAAVARQDAAALDKAANVVLIWTKTLTAEKFDYDVLSPRELLKRTAGCRSEWVSEKYGEFQLVCTGKAKAGEKCFDQAIGGNVRRFERNGVSRDVVRFQETESWSTQRCGKAPIFVPSPPPQPRREKR